MHALSLSGALVADLMHMLNVHVVKCTCTCATEKVLQSIVVSGDTDTGY